MPESPAATDRAFSRGVLAVWFAALAWVVVGLAAQAGQFAIQPQAVLAIGAALPLLALAARWWPSGGMRPPAALWVVLFSAAALGVGLETLEPGALPYGAWVGLRILNAGVLLLAGWAVASGRPREAWFTGSALGVLAATWCVQIASQREVAVDVVYVVQQAAEAVARGANPYAVQFTFPDWMVAADFAVTTGPYPYLPMSAVLLAVPAALFSAARVGLVVAIVLVAPALRPLLGWAGALRVALLVAALPDTSTLVVSSWIEPVLLVLLIAAYTQFARARPRSAVVWLGIALATKHTAFLGVPALLRWPAAGWRRVLQALGVATLLVAPFVLWDPARFADGPLSVFGLAADQRADSVSLPGLLVAAGLSSPWWLTLLGLAAALAAVPRAATLSQALIATATCMTVLFWFSAHGFYNFYWLAAGLIATALGTVAVATQAPATGPGMIESRRGDSNP